MASAGHTAVGMAIYLLTGDDESLVRTAVADLVHDLVGDG